MVSWLIPCAARASYAYGSGGKVKLIVESPVAQPQQRCRFDAPARRGSGRLSHRLLQSAPGATPAGGLDQLAGKERAGAVRSITRGAVERAIRAVRARVSPFCAAGVAHILLSLRARIALTQWCELRTARRTCLSERQRRQRQDEPELPQQAAPFQIEPMSH